MRIKNFKYGMQSMFIQNENLIGNAFISSIIANLLFVELLALIEEMA